VRLAIDCHVVDVVKAEDHFFHLDGINFCPPTLMISVTRPRI